jgi:serine-type D-Ala-D-Ala carboxypeptidase (penicillin-binding protein 5/6)
VRRQILKNKILQITIIFFLSLNLASAENISEDTAAIVAGDYKTGDIVIDHNGDEIIPIASTTKLMTYLVVRDEMENGNGSLSDELVIDSEVANTGGSTFSLAEGESVEIEMLLEAIMIVSGNDASIALSKHFGETEENFVSMMNDKAKEIGLENAKFYTATGLPDEEKRENSMTARELYELSAHIIGKYPEILDTTEKPKLVVKERDYSESNTNPLIGVVDGVDGLKTGYTTNAGRCLIATAEQKDGNRVIGVVMGAESEQSRVKKSEMLMRSLINEYNTRKIYTYKKALGERSIGRFESQKIELYPVKDVEVFVENDTDTPKQTIKMRQDLNLPIKPGDVVGTLNLEYGLVEKQVDLTVGEEITQFKLFRIGISNYLKSII